MPLSCRLMCALNANSKEQPVTTPKNSQPATKYKWDTKISNQRNSPNYGVRKFQIKTTSISSKSPRAFVGSVSSRWTTSGLRTASNFQWEIVRTEWFLVAWSLVGRMQKACVFRVTFKRLVQFPHYQSLKPRQIKVLPGVLVSFE